MNDMRLYLHLGPHGEVRGKILTRTPLPEQNYDCVIEDRDAMAQLMSNAERLHVRSGKVVPRPELSLWADKMRLKADGEDVSTVTIAGVPAGQTVRLVVGTGKPFELPAGETLEITADHSTVIQVTVVDPRYCPAGIMLTAIGGEPNHAT